MLEERLEEINQKYARRREQIERTYRTLQRRTILYGIAAILLGMLISLIVVRGLGLSVLQAFALGSTIGVVLQQISWLIARTRTPYP